MIKQKEILRCPWCERNSVMQKYHDTEWGIPLHDDRKLFEFIVLDTFQAGLSWNAVLQKRNNFEKAFDNFNAKKIAAYDQKKIDALLLDAGIIRNKLKIKAFYDRDAMVYSRTKQTLKGYLNQKARHTQTSFHYLLSRRIIMAVWHLLNLLMLASLFLTFTNIDFIWLFITKMTTDTILLLYTKEKSGYRFNIIEIIYLDIVYEIFIIINFFNAIFRKIEWK